MRRSWLVFLLLAGTLLLLVSLYLPWQHSTTGLLDLGGNLTVDGWSSGIGQAAGMFALLLAGLAVVALARPTLSQRLPLGRCAFTTCYFGLAVGAAARSGAQQQESAVKGLHFHYAYGTYFGVTGAIVVLLAAGAMRRRELRRYRSASNFVVVALVVGVLASFLLPWERYGSPGPVTFLGIASPAATVAAALALWLPAAWLRTDAVTRTERLVLATALALLTGAAFSSNTFPGTHAYGAWIGLVGASAIVALALIQAGGIARPELPSWHTLASCGAAVLLVASLFLPWQKLCYGTAKEFGLYAGRCVSTNGWTTPLGTAAAALALGLVIATLAPRYLPVSTTPLAAGIGLLVATFGFQLSDRSGEGFRFEFGYGSTIGFASAGLLLALVMVRVRLPAFDQSRVTVRLAPIAACAAYLVVVVPPWWGVLPHNVQSALGFAPVSWLTITGAVLAILLLHLWIRQIANGSSNADWLVLLPLGLLALALLDLIRLRHDGINWGRGIVVALCLLLTLLGRLEQRGGLDDLRVPAVLRIDRL